MTDIDRSILTSSIGEPVTESFSTSSTSLDITTILTLSLLVLFVILLVFEVVRPYRKFDRKIAKDSFTTNTTAFLFNNTILTLLSASSLFVIAQQYSYVGLLSNLPSGPTKWLLSFVLFDLAIYMWHVASHRFEWLWCFHKIHHSDKSFNVTTGFRFHVFDTFIELIFKCVVIVLLGIDAYTVLVCELVKTLFVMFHHCNISFRGERALSRIIIVPFLHRTHHSALRSEHDSNYGIVLSIWDIIFMTRNEKQPSEIGLQLIEAENFIQLFCLAFITERRLLKLLRMIPRGR